MVAGKYLPGEARDTRGRRAVDPPLVAGYASMDPLAPDPPAAVDAKGATEPLAPVAVTGRVNGILLGVALPVALRPTVKKKKACIEQKEEKRTRIFRKRHVQGLHSIDCNARAAWESAVLQFDAIHEPASTWN